MEVYVGKLPDGPFAVNTSGMSVVERLVEMITRNKQKLHSREFFFVPFSLLGEKLVNEHQLALVGTLQN